MTPSFYCPECFLPFDDWSKAQDHREKTGHECRVEKGE
jgi:hypothetical protein